RHTRWPRDRSSDVCSSDLDILVGLPYERVTLSYGNPTKISLPVFSPQSISSLVEKRGVDRILLAGGEAWDDYPAEELLKLRIKEIGRASCRERVNNEDVTD